MTCALAAVGSDTYHLLPKSIELCTPKRAPTSEEFIPLTSTVSRHGSGQRPYRDDGRRGCSTPPLADARAIPGSPGRGQLDSRPQLHRDGNPNRLSGSRLAGAAHWRSLLPFARGAPDSRARMGLCTLRHAATSCRCLERNQGSNDHSFESAIT